MSEVFLLKMPKEDLNEILLTLDDKVDKVDGKGLTTNDFTDSYKNQIENIFDIIYPIGSLYMSTEPTSPASLFGGTWTQIKDKFILAAGDNHLVGEEGGEEQHTLTGSEMPAHSHFVPSNVSADGSGIMTGGYLDASNVNDYSTTHWYVATNERGGNAAHNNMPPYLSVYVWKRVLPSESVEEW